jgi:PIN domain nuclease of toxin-antitoxin system
VIYLDTHVVVWLFAGRKDLLSETAVQLINENDLYVSPMVILEIHLLKEIGRLTVAGDEVSNDLSQRIGLRICDAPFLQIAQAASTQVWTRDPFDRVIVGQATVRDKPLLTKDQTIRDHFQAAVW